MKNSYTLKFSRKSFFHQASATFKPLNYFVRRIECLIILEPRICIIISAITTGATAIVLVTRCTRRHDCYYETRENVSGSNRYSISGNKTADRVRVPRQQQISVENLSVCTRVLPYLPVECGETCAFQSRDWERARGRALSPEASFTGQKIMGWLYHLADVRIFLPLHLQSPLVLAQHVRVYVVREYTHIDRTPLTFESSLCPSPI